MNTFFRKLAWLAHRRDREAELRAELEFHLGEESEERMSGGGSPAEARLEARRELGNVARVAEETRAAWGWTLAEQFAQDLRYAVRNMASNKAFSALAILSLALGIGANTAIFSFMDSILLRSLPVDHPERLVILSSWTKENEVHGMNLHDDSFLPSGTGYGDSVFSYAAFAMFQSNDRLFSDVFGYQGAGDLHFAAGDRADIAKTEYVTGNYFQALGVPPVAGRLITREDDRAGAPAVAVISDALSRLRFGSAENATGKPVSINRRPFTVIGVAPPGFFGADPGIAPDVYIPLHAIETLARAGFAKQSFNDPNTEWVVTMARLRPGVSREQAQEVLAPQFAEWMRTVNTERNRADLPRFVVRDGRAGLNGLRYQYSRPLTILLILVGLILILACANIANLLLARSTARRREIAVRLGIGAGRSRLVRQLLTESVLLASTGGASGILFAIWGINFLTALIGNGQENFTLHAGLNWRVLAATAGLAIATGLLFGVSPALQATRVDLLPALKESRIGGGTARGRGIGSISRGLLVLQMALSLVILVTAGLFVRTLNKLESIQLGFNRENVLTFSLNATQAGHRDAEVYDFYGKLRDRFAGIPGVRGASFSDLRLVGGRMFTGVSVGGDKPRASLVVSVGPDFLSTMQIPLRLGRELGLHDMAPSHPAAMVNQEFVKLRMGGQNPLGQLVSFGSASCAKCSAEIVGVSGNAMVGRDVTDEFRPVVYVPYTMKVWGGLRDMYYELRTVGSPMAVAGAVRELVREADPRLPVSDLQTQSALIDGTINREVIFARLCSGFAVLALVIACVGLYGSMSYNVARRTGEIGIRMALGAPRRSVIRMVLGEVLLLAGLGLAIGLSAALVGSKLVKSFLYQTEPHDPLTMAVAAASLVVAAILAGYLPARSAANIDPMSALRHE
jgi:macrolide transport system ATP-binding/permease protein